jgi:hypothetical protein
MSLIASPYGLSLVSYKGGKFRGSTSTYYISSAYSVSLGQGDAIQMGTGGLAQAYSAQTPDSTDASQMTIGTFVSVTYVNSQGQTVISPYWPASTATYNNTNPIITVNDLPYCVYKVQMSGTLGIASPNTAVGKNYNLVANLPNAATGQSTQSLSNDAGTAAYLTCKIVGLADAPVGGTNSWYDTYADVLVIINNHAYKAGTIGV